MEGLQTKPTSYLQATWAGEEKYDRYGQLPTSTTYNGDYYTVSWTGQYSGQVIELNVVVSWNLGITKDSTNRTLELRGMVVPNDQ